MTTPTRRTVLTVMLAAPFATLATRSHATAHTVSIAGFAFSPAELTLNAGDTVTFTNADNAPHTATADDGSFDTGRLNNGQSASVTIAAAGTFSYKCSFHPNMRGTITAT